MDPIAITHHLMARELATFAREIEAFRSDADVWATVPGITNSAGNLAQHICGNLLYYIGALLGGSGYVREREAEFAAQGRTRAQLAADLRDASAIVTRVFAGRTLADFPEAFPADLAGARLPTSLFLAHLEAHLAFHLGQAGYLRRALTGDTTSTGPLPLSALAEFGER
jgi:hypothetical protein